MSFTFVNEIAKDIFDLRYAQKKTTQVETIVDNKPVTNSVEKLETWEEACERVAIHISKAEEPARQLKYQDEFYEELVEGRFMPGGRIWYGAGRNKAQLLNCVSGNTLVHTKNGLVPAKELVGQEIDVLSQGGVYRKAKWDSYGKQELFKILLSNGDELFATAGHEWVVIKQDRHGYEKITTEELPGRRIPIQHIANFDYDNAEFENGVRHGLTFGDGALYMNGRYSLLPQFGDSKHLVEDYFDKNSKWPSINATVATKLPNKYKNLPSIIENSSYIRGFIAGFIGADGSVDSRGHVMVHQAKLDVLVQVRRLAASVGLPSTTIKMVREFNPFNGASAPLYKLTFVKQGFDEKMLVKNKHKELFLNSPQTTKQQNIKVESVVSTFKTEEVYCCNEPETHTFVIEAGYLTGNCYVLGGTNKDDSREGWGNLLSDSLVISGTGGGFGTNYSEIRPRGTPIVGTGGEATGPVSLMRIVNGVCEEIKAGGNRRSAIMMCLNHDHPDIMEFLNAKLENGQINNANISVVFMNESPADFFERVRNDGDHDLVWKGKVVKTIKARVLWDLLVKNGLKNGEPGILNFHMANEQNNIWYARKLTSTNPCGEIAMAEYGNCCLGAVVLPRFVKRDSKAKNVKDRFDWEALHNTVGRGIRFLDDVLTVNHYPIPETEAESKAIRRLGLGIMGLHDMLLMLGLKYSSQEGRDFVDKVMSFIKHTAYDTSTYLAVEKGAFPEFDSAKFLQSGFAKTLKPSIRNKIRDYGMRNCAVLTIAPTGTTSMVQGVSSGIEPMFSYAYERRYRDTDENGFTQLKTKNVAHPLFEEAVRTEADLSHFEGSDDISPRDQFMMQVVCQRHVDNAISKTINIPQDKYTPEMLGELYMEFIPQLKGTTIFPVGSRPDAPLTPIPLDQAFEMIMSGAMQAEQVLIDTCASGSCGL